MHGKSASRKLLERRITVVPGKEAGNLEATKGENERRKKDVHRRVVHYREGTGVLRSSCCDSSAVRASLSSALTVCDPTKKCFLHPSLIIYFSFIFPTPPIISGTSRGWCAAVFSIPQQCSQYVTLQKMFLTSKFSYLLFFLFFQLHPSFPGLPRRWCGAVSYTADTARKICSLYWENNFFLWASVSFGQARRGGGRRRNRANVGSSVLGRSGLVLLSHLSCKEEEEEEEEEEEAR